MMDLKEEIKSFLHRNETVERGEELVGHQGNETEDNSGSLNLTTSRKKTATKTVLTVVLVTILFLGYDKMEQQFMEAPVGRRFLSWQDIKMEQQFMGAKKATAYNDHAHIRTREEYLEVTSNCMWEPNHGNDILTVSLAHADDEHTHHSTRDVQTTWCTVKLSENSYLGSIRMHFGELLPGLHYVLENGEDHDLSMFWDKVNEMSPSREFKTLVTAGFGWPMLRDGGENAELKPAAYPPVHTHHGIYTLIGEREHDAVPSRITFHGDNYCSERDDHCLWESFEEGYGLEWSYDGKLHLNYYIETVAALHCPSEPFPSGSEVIIEVAFELTMAPAMKRISSIPHGSVLSMSPGNPIDLEHETDIRPYAPHLMQAPVGRSIMSWQDIKFPAGRFAKQDLDGYVKMHTHTAHTSAALLFRAAPMDLGLEQGKFIRKVNVFEHSVPLLLGDTSIGGNGFSLEEAKAYVLAHVMNGADAAEGIPEMHVDSSIMKQLGGERLLSSNDRNKLMCVWTGPSVGYGNCDESSLYSDGFDRRPQMHSPPGGNCLADWKDGETLTWVYFSTPSERGSPLLHSTFYPCGIIYDDENSGSEKVELGS